MSIKVGFVAGVSVTLGAPRTIVGAVTANPAAAMPVRNSRLPTSMGGDELASQAAQTPKECRIRSRMKLLDFEMAIYRLSDTAIKSRDVYVSYQRFARLQTKVLCKRKRSFLIFLTMPLLWFNRRSFEPLPDIRPDANAVMSACGPFRPRP
jgi:hypothetical protein